MARKRVASPGADFTTPAKEVIDTPLQDELSDSFLQYSYTVIQSRALPDVRDGLKPVHRRILFSMHEMGLRPEKHYVKVAKISGNCFPAGSLVHTPEGLMPIEGVEPGDKVLDPEGNVVSVVRTFENPVGGMVRVSGSGFSIDATPGQLFRVLNDDYSVGWVEARDLVGRRVLRLGRFGDGQDVVGSDDLTPYVFGLLGSEGSCGVNAADPKADRRVSVGMTDAEPMEIIKAWADKAGFKYTATYKSGSHDGFLPQHIVRFRSAHTDKIREAVNAKQPERTVPPSVLKCRSWWVPFIAGFIDGDGSVRSEPTRIHIANTSREMLVQIQAMLAGLGVVASLYYQPKDNLKWKDLFTLEAYGENARRLAALIRPFLRVPSKATQSLEIIRGVDYPHQPKTERIPGGALLSEFTSRHLGAGWFEDVDGVKFRQSMDFGSAKFRHGKSAGVDYKNRLYGIEMMYDHGWVDKLRRLGSPLAERLDDLRGYTFPLVTSVEQLNDAPNYDIQVDSDEHAFLVNGTIVHNCMGLYHPHGDGSINDALVRMAQDFSMSTPLIDGHGNFGSLDSGAAAARYIEAKLAPSAMFLIDSVDEGTVDMRPNYDGSLLEPTVLPATFPNVLVNGAEGIAVGMATKMAPHNLAETVAAARLMLKKPKCSIDDILAVMPGPDFPGGAQILGTAGIREAYETGKGTIRMRATTQIEPVEGSRGRQQIIVSGLPYAVGPERVIEAIKKGISEKRITFVSDVIDLSEGVEMALHIELKSGVNPEKALSTLLALTPMETTFAISNLVLVNGQPRVLTVLEILSEFLAFRREVVLRRSEFRRTKAQARLHLVDGLLIALDAIDVVVKIIRASKTTVEAKESLVKKFKFSDLQVAHVLEMPLRRLTSLEVSTLVEEKRELDAVIADLTEIIEVPKRLTKVVDVELAAASASVGTPRQSVIGDGVAAVAELSATGAGKATEGKSVSATALEPTEWFLTEKGLLTRSPAGSDVVVSSATASNHLLLLCADGVAVRVPAECPDGAKASMIANHSADVVGVASPDVVLAAGTRDGVVKVCKPDWPTRGDEFPFMKVATGDVVVWAGALVEGADFVFVTSDAQLLRFGSAGVRPQGRSGSGMTGMKVKDGARVVACAAVPGDGFVVVSHSASGRGKHTAVSEFPVKGRGGSGVRCHGLLKGDTGLVDAAILPAGSKGLPPVGKRDGSGSASTR